MPGSAGKWMILAVRDGRIKGVSQGFYIGQDRWVEPFDDEYDSEADAVAAVSDLPQSAIDFRTRHGFINYCLGYWENGWDYNPTTKTASKPLEWIISEHDYGITYHRDEQIKALEVDVGGVPHPAPRSPNSFHAFRSRVVTANTTPDGETEFRITHRSASGQVLTFLTLTAANEYMTKVDAEIGKLDAAADLTKQEWDAILAAHTDNPTEETEAAIRAYNRETRFAHHLAAGIGASTILADYRQAKKERLEGYANALHRKIRGVTPAGAVLPITDTNIKGFVARLDTLIADANKRFLLAFDEDAVNAIYSPTLEALGTVASDHDAWQEAQESDSDTEDA